MTTRTVNTTCHRLDSGERIRNATSINLPQNKVGIDAQRSRILVNPCQQDYTRRGYRETRKKTGGEKCTLRGYIREGRGRRRGGGWKDTRRAFLTLHRVIFSFPLLSSFLPFLSLPPPRLSTSFSSQPLQPSPFAQRHVFDDDDSFNEIPLLF